MVLQNFTFFDWKTNQFNDQSNILNFKNGGFLTNFAVFKVKIGTFWLFL